MVGHSEGIRDILVAYTGYTGGYHPNSRGINEIDATNKFLVKPKETFDMDTHWRVERYTIDVVAESESTLQTMKNGLLSCATDRSDGYIPDGTANHPYRIEFSHDNLNLDLGPNRFGKRLVLIAFYEVS